MASWNRDPPRRFQSLGWHELRRATSHCADFNVDLVPVSLQVLQAPCTGKSSRIWRWPHFAGSGTLRHCHQTTKWGKKKTSFSKHSLSMNHTSP